MPLETSFSRGGVLRALMPLLILLLGVPLSATGQTSTSPAMVLSFTGTRPQPTTQPTSDEADIQIMQALDKPVSLDVDDAPIRDVFQSLAESAGVSVDLSQETLDLLPYGSRTLVSVTIERRPLKESLTAILRPLGLTFRPENSTIAIVPTPPLQRIARRATWEELELLEKLYSTSWSKELFDTLQFQFQDARAGYADANRERLFETAGSVGVGSAAEVLEHACDKYGWSWVPNGQVIVITSKVRMIERQLNKRVTVNYLQTSLEQALLDLGDRAGVLVHLDPGVLASVPAHVAEGLNVSVENGTIRQVLEFIAGMTGLAYSIDQNGIRISPNPSAPPVTGGPSDADTLRALRSNPIVGQIMIPNPDGTSFAFFIREEDLPPEVNVMRKARIKKAVDEMRKSLINEQPKD